MALIERAEAIADSTDWVKTAEEFKKLQAEWQAIGAVPRQDSRTTWKRFRDACDRFFTRRNADLAQRKEVWSANLARKEALCVRAEELADSTDWESAASEMRRMQTDWKAIGPVRRSKSEAIWQRFRTAARHLLRPLQASRPDRARIETGGPRSTRRGSGNACRRPRRPPNQRPSSSRCVRFAIAGTSPRLSSVRARTHSARAS